MSKGLSLKEIGKRLMELRRAKSLSQEELATEVGIPRSSLAQVELGNRYVDVLELQRLSVALRFSLDDFFSPAFNPMQKEAVKGEKVKGVKEDRESVPTLQVAKFKNILLYILERCAGKPNVGETVLYKLLYFCDFNYYELYEEHLTGAKYRKLPYGPVPQKLDAIIGQMIDEGELKKVKTTYHDYTQTRYLPLKKPNLTLIKASEKEVLDKVIAQFSDWSAAMISDYSHKDLPWLVTDEGKEISYELAFYREQPYSVRVYNENEEA